MPALPLPAPDRFRRPCYLILTMSALVVMVSCASEDDGLGKRYPVSGTVTYNGKPLEKGDISFVSEDLKANVSASGPITNGAYTLSTGGNQDGAQAGKYKVTVTSKEDFTTKAQADFQKESGQTNPKLPPHFVAKAEAASKNLVPVGYGDVRSTTLTAEVKAESNTISFELSDDKAPPEAAKATGRAGGRKKDKD
jgi:major membrane immunogen (membrane-anchored lipoprotein)